jgi:type II secretory pathway component PulM
MNMMTKLTDNIQPHIERLNTWLVQMSVRERVMVIATSIFVLVVAIGSALYFMHRAAETQTQRLNQLKETMVWMQHHAAQMQANQNGDISSTDKVQRAAQQQNMAVSVQQDGEELRIQASHAQYVTLASFLTSLSQMGLTIEKLELNQEAGQIKLSATLL